jgi:hypothetical protein
MYEAKSWRITYRRVTAMEREVGVQVPNTEKMLDNYIIAGYKAC